MSNYNNFDPRFPKIPLYFQILPHPPIPQRFPPQPLSSNPSFPSFHIQSHIPFSVPIPLMNPSGNNWNQAIPSNQYSKDDGMKVNFQHYYPIQQPQRVPAQLNTFKPDAYSKEAVLNIQNANSIAEAEVVYYDAVWNKHNTKYVYTTMMNAYMQQKQFQKAVGVYSEMQQANVKPDKITYMTLIKCYFEMNEFEQAWSVFDKKIRPNIQFLDTKMYNAMMVGCLKQNNFAKLHALYQELCAHFAPDNTSYNLVMKGYNKQNNFEAPWTFFNDLLIDKHIVVFDGLIYNSLLYSCIKLRNFDRIEGVLEIMATANIQPSIKNYNLLIDIYIKEDKKHDKCDTTFFDLAMKMYIASGLSPQIQQISNCQTLVFDNRSHGTSCIEFFLFNQQHQPPYNANTGKSLRPAYGKESGYEEVFRKHDEIKDFARKYLPQLSLKAIPGNEGTMKITLKSTQDV